MKNILCIRLLINKKFYLLISVFFISVFVFAQDLSRLSSVKVDELSNQQVQEVWNRAQNSGYSIDQLKLMAKAQGMPAVELDKLINRINNLTNKYYNDNYFNKQSDIDSVVQDTTAFYKYQYLREKESIESNLFGYSFFNNPNISFTPNINMATPQNYQLGPDDVLRIDVWGAAENTFIKKISNEGYIQISGIGQINLNGLSLKDATSKINGQLKKIYYGIGASENSYSKVYTNVVLDNIRTVQVNIIGEVKVPGTYALNGLSTVLNALYACGGPTTLGSFRNIKIVRNGQFLNSFDIYNYIINGSEKGNVQLQDQDIIIVEPFINRIKIFGEVKRQGIYELTKDETFIDLLKYTSGFTSQAYKKSIAIERFTDTQREIKELNFEKNKNILLKNGDSIFVKKVLDIYSNKVTIEGAVNHPGNYEYYEGMTVKDLIHKAEGIKKIANLDKAIIIRKDEFDENNVISFALKKVLKDSLNIILQENDSVNIFSKEDLRDNKYISINGAVNKPLKMNFMDGITVQDFIALAGGLKQGADIKNIEIARRVNDEDFSTVAKSIIVSVNENLDNSGTVNTLLHPFDVVTVRYRKGFTTQKNVSITGEVQFPGIYTIQNEDEKISDLVKRAGGFTPYAYVKGATLIRVKKKEEKQSDALKMIVKRDSLFETIEPELKSFKVGIDLNKIMKEQGGVVDLTLKENDEIIVPKIIQTVEVQGKVFTPSMVQFLKGKSLKHYIDNAGGFTSDANKKKVYVVYQNGEIKTTKSFLFLRSYPGIEPGATVLVPEKPERKQILTTDQFLGITTGVTTLIVLIDKLLK